MSASIAPAQGLQLSLVPCPSSFRMEFVPLSKAPLGALQLPALPFLVVLVEAAGLQWFWNHPMILPCPWVRFHAHLHCPCSRSQVVSCAWLYIILYGHRPLPGDSLPALWLPALLLWPSLRPRVCESSNLSLVLPLQGSVTYLAFVSLFGAQSESLTHSIARSFSAESLSTYAVGLADAFWLCPERAIRFFFVSVSFVDPVRIIASLAPCLR